MSLQYYNLFTLFTFLPEFLNIIFFLHVLLAAAACLNTFYIFFNKYNRILILYFYFLTFLIFLIFLFKFYLNFKISSSTFNFKSTCYTVYSGYFSDVLVLLSVIITIITWIYLSERYQHHQAYHVFYFFIFISLTANMVYSTNFLSVFIFFELLFLPSLYFVYKFGYAKKVEKTINFLLVWTLTGSFLVLMGLAYIISVHGTLDVIFLSQILFTKTEKFVLFFLFFIGFGVKVPIWPFHYWLTKVHVEAPTGFSIFLSGFLVKTAFFCLTYFFSIIADTQTILVATTIVIWGFIDASLRMWASTDIKRLIAFATIQEMNLISLFLFLLSHTNYLFLNLFLFVHGVLSAFLFFLVDIIQKRSYTRNLSTLSGFSVFMPKLHYLVWCAILIFRGFPLFIKFFIEWELLAVLYINFGLLGIFLFAVTSVFGVLGFCRIWFMILYGQPTISLINQVDILRKDWIIGCSLVSILFGCSIFFYLFKWLEFCKKVLLQLRLTAQP